MSVALRTKRFEPTVVAPTPRATVVPPTPRRHEPEAPEWGVVEREAPELRRGSPAEDSDHGKGRAYHLKHVFTHGRSQS